MDEKGDTGLEQCAAKRAAKAGTAASAAAESALYALMAAAAMGARVQALPAASEHFDDAVRRRAAVAKDCRADGIQRKASIQAAARGDGGIEQGGKALTDKQRAF